MKMLLPVTASAAVLLSLALTAQEGRDAQETESTTGRLERVEVEDDAATPDALRGGGQLDLEQVITLLTDPDLDQRERNFDSLVRAAQVDRAVLKLIDDVASSRSDVELAWTARLALREVRRGSGLPGIFGRRPFDVQIPGLEDLQGFGLFNPTLPTLPFGPGVQGSQRSFEIRQEDGQFVLRIREQENGEEKTREYRGETLDEILEANPELREEMTFRTEGVPGGLRFHITPVTSREEWQRIVEGLRRGQHDLFRVFEGGGPNDLKEFLHPLESSRPVNPGRLGVRVAPISPAQAAELGLEENVGLYVASVEPGSMAHLLGVGQGSVLLELNDLPLQTADDITRILRTRIPEDPVHLLWIDGSGEKRTNAWRPEKK